MLPPSTSLVRAPIGALDRLRGHAAPGGTPDGRPSVVAHRPVEDAATAVPATLPSGSPAAGPRAQLPRPVPHEFGPADITERAWTQAAALRPGALIAVSSADGGVGRSTLVAALGGILALAVPGPPVVAIDMNPVPWGGLADRVTRSHPGSMWDALRDLHTLTTHREVERWAQRGPTGLAALVGEMETYDGRRPPTHDEAVAVVDGVRRLYPLTIVDAMVAQIRGVWRTLAAAAAPVLVARASIDSLQHTMRLLAILRIAGFTATADACVLVVMTTSSDASREVRAVARQASTTAGDVVTVPYDPQLAQAAPIDPRRLRKPTRRALIDVAAAVLDRCTDPHRLAAVDAQERAR